jgi:phosphohistidine phosphatase
VHLYLVHHGDTVGPDVDPARPLSIRGIEASEALAGAAAARGTRPAVVWHSGKLRAKQTAEIYRRACNALAACSATRDLQPDDPPRWMRERLRGEPGDVMIVGHFPHLPRLLAELCGINDVPVTFPPHGLVALSSDDEGETWSEEWRLE